MAFDPVTAAIEVGGKAITAFIDHFFPDPAQKSAAMLQLEQMKQTGELAQLAADTDLAKGQLAINQVEAGSDDKFTSRWRPFIGWVCGVAFAYHFVAEPFMMFLITCYRGVCVQPNFDMSTLLTVLMGLLGLGSLRTLEKVRGVA